jgi:hypothetical protein
MARICVSTSAFRDKQRRILANNFFTLLQELTSTKGKNLRDGYIRWVNKEKKQDHEVPLPEGNHTHSSQS